MLVTSRTRADEQILLDFLHKRGVGLASSVDLRMIGRFSEGKLVAVVAFNGWVGRTCSMHCAGDGNWINRELLKASFEFAFNKNDCVRVHATVAASNARALKLDKHLGFKVLDVVPLGWDTETDLIILGMAKEDCRWIRSIKHGKQSLSTCIA
jgi:RimJ/RimL family protein N-acetyltransferase